MPPPNWGGGDEERGAEKQDIERGRKVSFLTVCMWLGGAAAQTLPKQTLYP